MRRVQTGLHTTIYYFSLDEVQQYHEQMKECERSSLCAKVVPLFVENGYAFEYTTPAIIIR